MGNGTDVKPQSRDGSATMLLELSALLQAGRPELALTGRVASPAAHEEVANRYLMVSGALAVFTNEGKVVKALVIPELTFVKGKLPAGVVVQRGYELTAP